MIPVDNANNFACGRSAIATEALAFVRATAR
jgi:hypothetical protein